MSINHIADLCIICAWLFSCLLGCSNSSPY